MSSNESDDEPLSILAATKRLNPEIFEITKVCVNKEDAKKKKTVMDAQKMSITIKLRNSELESKIIERPSDVWLYMKDLNPGGPYSCLLCSEWFINRSKLVVHYIINHKKDFCGICRYFVENREIWKKHMAYHIPWSCSQCTDTFQSEKEMRQHLSEAHNLVHCRLCHFRLSDDEQYNSHLLKKHCVTNLVIKSEELLWINDDTNSLKFTCNLCCKRNVLTTNFFNHYMGYHHFTLKCFTYFLSGQDIQFTVDGADVSSQFVDGQLKNRLKFGYVDLDKNNEHEGFSATEIKQEILSESEDTQESQQAKPDASSKENNVDFDEDNKPIKTESVNTYKGYEDFDVTSMELIVVQKCYFYYILGLENQMKSKIFPEVSSIDYASTNVDIRINFHCALCQMKVDSLHAYILHMLKMHFVKAEPTFSCRICTATFETQQELGNHETNEMKDFEDLWLCQFCDKEFKDRESTRRHLNEHWDILEFDNCFSPHLGFKCKFCPTLFWNETDRKTHQIRVHFNQHKEDFYKCESCSMIFTDKEWFVYHFMERHQSDDDEATHCLFKCCLCCNVQSSIEEMRTHFKSEHPEARKIFCSMGSCMYRPLSQKKSFKMHVKMVHKSEKSKPECCTCVICGREFSSLRAVSTHMSQVHGPGKFKCVLCREVMHTADERKLHYLIRHPGRHPFVCKDCGKSFQYKSSLYMHRQEHSPVKQSFTCTYCSKVFNKKDSYREHVQIHEGPRHACSYCPKRFVQRSNMLRHERRHTGERPYACPHCPRTFADKGACTAHSRTHTKDKAYACLYCGQTFVQKSKLTYHIRKHTGENLETCTVCSKMFTSACSLREHMKTHNTKKANVPCPLCGRTYQDERYMLRHLRSIHTTTRYTCPLCRKALTSAAGLRHHVVTHSDINMYRCKICPKSYAVRRTLVKHLRRRHLLKGVTDVTKDFYQILDPRDCNLGLEEEVMNEIFGPPKKTPEVLIQNLVDLKQLTDTHGTQDANDNEDGEETGSDKDKTDDESGDDKDGNGDEGNARELEPTDFVSVKIEPYDMEEDEDIE
ncbi:hypothetical protein ACJJTC_013199 [Scirpophaga incertulas]